MEILKFTRRAALLACATTLAFAASAADPYPARPVKLIVAFGAGGSGDQVARLYGQKMSEILGQPIVVENKPGAQQMVAIRSLQASAPDGYTLYLGTGSSMAQNPALRKDLGYDPRKDFAIVGMLGTVTGVVFCDPKLPVKNMKEFVAYAKANPGKLNYGSAGIGTAGHLAGELLASATGIRMAHIAYKSDADVIREVMAGTVQLGIMTTVNTVQHVKAGNIRGLAVTTSKRLPYLPEVESLSETGIKGMADLEPHTFYTLVGPAGMPAPVVERLVAAIDKASADPDVATRMRTMFYAEPMTGTPATTRAFLDKEFAKWAALSSSIKVTE
jgi:tripartite-type tricarboxylate transporter receptor subunit TctC